MSIYYGKTNAIISSGSGGELNLAYGLTPPTDTSKIWVRTDKTPTNIEITTEPTWSNTITSEIISEEMISTLGLIRMLRAGEYLYFIGGVDNSANPYESYSSLRRYNPFTNEIETLNVKLPYGIERCALCTYKDYIYIFYGWNRVSSDNYLQERVIKFNWKRNTVFTITRNIIPSTPNTCYYRAYKEAYVIGSKAYLMWGGDAYSPTTSGNYNKNAGSVTGTGGNTDGFDLEKDEFVSINTNSNSVLSNADAFSKTIKKIPLAFGGYWNNYLPTTYGTITKNKNVKTETLTISNFSNITGLYGSMPIILTTNDGLYVMGGTQGTSSSSVSLTNAIKYIKYSDNSITTKTETLPLSNYWNSCQYDEQTSYGTSGKYLLKVENKISLEENKLLIIPDVESEDTYNITNDVENPQLNYKTSIQSMFIGNSSGKAERVRCYIYENESWKGINCDDYIPQTKLNLTMSSTWLNTTGTSLTSNIMCNVGDLVIASVIARASGNESVSSGWTLLGRSQTGQDNQTLAFYYKIATSKIETITITQSSSALLYISMCSFAGKTTATMGTFTTNSNANRVDFTLPNKLCLVSASFNLWSSSSPYGKWSYYNPYDNTFKDYQQVVVSQYIQQRLGTWLDYGGGGTRSARKDVGASGNTGIVGYVEIE